MDESAEHLPVKLNSISDKVLESEIFKAYSKCLDYVCDYPQTFNDIEDYHTAKKQLDLLMGELSKRRLLAQVNKLGE